jgi:hypothetical protein
MRELAVDKAPAMEQLQAALLELVQILQPDVNLSQVSGNVAASSSLQLDLQPPNAEQEWLIHFIEFRITNVDAADTIELQYRDEQTSNQLTLAFSLGSDFVDGRLIWPQFLPSKTTQLNGSPLMVPLIGKLKANGETWKRPRANLITSAVVATRTLTARFLYAPRNRLFD